MKLKPKFGDKKRNRGTAPSVGDMQMRRAIKKQGTSKSSQTVADQEILASENEQSQNLRGR